MTMPHVIVIGAGPGGLSAVRDLASSRKVAVTLVQRTGMANFLPGILPVLAGLRSPDTYRSQIAMSAVQVQAGEVIGLDVGRVTLADGSILTADAVIAAPGLVTDISSLPTGSRNLPVWELNDAEKAQQVIQDFTGTRLLVAIADLPYRCPPAPYGLAITLKALFAQRGQMVHVVLTTPEERPLLALGSRVSDFIESLASAGQITLETSLRFDRAASRDGILIAQDGRQITYDLGLFIPSHRRPALLAHLPGNGALVQVDAQQRTAMERTWVVGDIAATQLPRAAGVAEAQGRTAAASVLATLGLAPLQAPVLPLPNCYVWTGLENAARIQVRFPNGMPPVGKPEMILENAGMALREEALRAVGQWRKSINE